MSKLRNSNLRSIEYTGNVTLPADTRRSYFMVIFASGSTGTVELGNGGGKVPVTDGGFWEPYVAPNSEILIESTGTYVVVTNV